MIGSDWQFEIRKPKYWSLYDTH